MTESEWLASRGPFTMLEWLGDRADARRLRLFAVACVRRVWALLPDDELRAAVEVVERFADGTASKNKLALARRRLASGLTSASATQAAYRTSDPKPREAARCAAMFATAAAGHQATVAAEMLGRRRAWADITHPAEMAESAVQARIFRCIVGNPFAPLALADACQTPTVQALARAAYEERALPSGELDAERLAVLADALEDAGATGDVLAHLRGPGPHVRGCHALDAALGRG